MGGDIKGHEKGSLFGAKVSLNAAGSILAVGAPFYGVNISEIGFPTGQVLFYEYVNDEWVQLGQSIDRIDNENISSFRLGDAIELSADGLTVVIGDYIVGVLRVYKFSNDSWIQIGQDFSGADGGSYFFGSYAAINSNGSIAAGSSHAFTGMGGADEIGYTRVFQKIYNQWVKIGQTIDNEGGSDHLLHLYAML